MSNLPWQPTATINTLKQRANIIHKIRAFFSERDYLEVDPPIMAAHGVTDCHLENIRANFQGQTYHLQTSPEYHMKRLLAAGSGPIFTLSHAFRDDELGRWHNPEFTMLEWYRPGFDYLALLAEVGELLEEVLQAGSLKTYTYQELFEQLCQINPHETSIKELVGVVYKHKLSEVLRPDKDTIDDYLYLLMTHIIEPYLQSLKSPIAIIDFPGTQAALAKIKNNKALRFEVYYKGIELANGFDELLDANIQKARFNKDNELRQAKQKQPQKPCPYLIEALTQGLPDCSGVALGIDRLIAKALNKNTIKDVLAFTIENA